MQFKSVKTSEPLRDPKLCLTLIEKKSHVKKNLDKNMIVLSQMEDMLIIMSRKMELTQLVLIGHIYSVISMTSAYSRFIPIVTLQGNVAGIDRCLS